MKRDVPDDHVRLAATNALLNSLEFTKQNFERDAERHFIMQVKFSNLFLITSGYFPAELETDTHIFKQT